MNPFENAELLAEQARLDSLRRMLAIGGPIRR